MARKGATAAAAAAAAEADVPALKVVFANDDDDDAKPATTKRKRVIVEEDSDATEVEGSDASGGGGEKSPVWHKKKKKAATDDGEEEDDSKTAAAAATSKKKPAKKSKGGGGGEEEEEETQSGRASILIYTPELPPDLSGLRKHPEYKEALHSETMVSDRSLLTISESTWGRFIFAVTRWEPLTPKRIAGYDTVISIIAEVLRIFAESHHGNTDRGHAAKASILTAVCAAWHSSSAPKNKLKLTCAMSTRARVDSGDPVTYQLKNLLTTHVSPTGDGFIHIGTTVISGRFNLLTQAIIRLSTITHRVYRTWEMIQHIKMPSGGSQQKLALEAYRLMLVDLNGAMSYIQAFSTTSQFWA